MLKAENEFEIPEGTVKTAKAAFPKGNRNMKMRDVFGPLFKDQDFAELYPSHGQPAVSPGRLAMVTVMQYAENLTDRQAAEAVRGRIDWKYALGLELEDPGFDFSVLSEFRVRLLEGGAEKLLLEKLLAALRAQGMLKGKHTQRTDATQVVAVLRQLNRLELVGETLRRALNELAQLAPEWLLEQMQPEWVERYGRTFDDYRLPKANEKRTALAEEVGRDGYLLLRAAYQPATPAEVSQAASVEMLRRIWLQQYYLEDEKVRWRSKKGAGLPPAGQRIASPDEPEARVGTKGGSFWRGYQVHFTETCDPRHPRLITNVQTTPANTNDIKVVPRVQDDLKAGGNMPQTHLVDGGYVSLDNLLDSRSKGIDLLGPIHEDRSWQARAQGGYDLSCFSLDMENMQATCPQGKTSVRFMQTKRRSGKPKFQFHFSEKDCLACQARPLCTRSKQAGRQLTVLPPAEYQALQAARERQKGESFKQLYQLRAGIEGTISQAVRALSVRRARYRGLARTHLQHLATAAAINFCRAADWLSGLRPETTRVDPFVALVQSV